MVAVDETKRLFGRFVTGVCVVTCLDAAGRPTGMTASSVTPLGLSPPSLLLCVGLGADVLPDLRREARYGVHVLHSGQEDLAWAFAMDGAAKRERIDALDLPWRQPLVSPPLMDGAYAWFDCRLRDELNGGDHRILIGEILAGGTGPAELEPMVYSGGRIGGRIDRPSDAGR